MKGSNPPPPTKVKPNPPPNPPPAPRKKAVRCAYWWERRAKGLRYVFARGQCKRMTAHPSGYCGDHKFMRPLEER